MAQQVDPTNRQQSLNKQPSWWMFSSFNLQDLSKSSDHRGTRHLEIEERKSLATTNKILVGLRVAVYFVLILTAVLSSWVAHSRTKAMETDNFEAHFREAAARLSLGYLYNCDLQNILPADQDIGIIVAVMQGLNQTESWEVEGPNATHLGVGDMHEEDYNHLAVTGEDYASALWTYSQCPTLTLYPTQDMEDSHSSNQPAKNAALTATIFAVIILVFFCYDCVVAYRQRILMQKAVTTSAFVSSLYPKQVRDRVLLGDSSETSKARRRSSLSGSKTENPLQRVVQNIPRRRSSQQGDHTRRLSNSEDQTSPNESSDDNSQRSSSSSQIIADLYPDTTIMFADLAGFTKWSNSKEPKQVFQLLETLYQAFDKLAERHQVFKVETIGDCYVAATGLPDPQPDHAIIMVKFAISCQKCMEMLTTSLTNALGEEVRQLAFRVGMHSGPITGGVLRGQKARFQLFGSTINTASRMESNGVPNQIHVSQATADEIIKFGHEGWLTQRKDTVVAKGLGEMQTYFVNYQPEEQELESSGKNTDSVVAVEEDFSNLFGGMFDCLFLNNC